MVSVTVCVSAEKAQQQHSGDQKHRSIWLSIRVGHTTKENSNKFWQTWYSNAFIHTSIRPLWFRLVRRVSQPLSFVLVRMDHTCQLGNRFVFFPSRWWQEKTFTRVQKTECGERRESLREELPSRCVTCRSQSLKTRSVALWKHLSARPRVEWKLLRLIFKALTLTPLFATNNYLLGHSLYWKPLCKGEITGWPHISWLSEWVQSHAYMVDNNDLICKMVKLSICIDRGSQKQAF